MGALQVVVGVRVAVRVQRICLPRAEGDGAGRSRAAVRDEDRFREGLAVDLSLRGQGELKRRDELAGSGELEWLRAVVGV